MYQLTVTKDQAKVMQQALDLYTRILMGQLHMVPETVAREYGTFPEYEQLERTMAELKDMLFPGKPGQAAFGIGSPELADKAKISVDILDVIRHRIAWDENPEGGLGVNFHSPMHWGTERLPEMVAV